MPGHLPHEPSPGFSTAGAGPSRRVVSTGKEAFHISREGIQGLLIPPLPTTMPGHLPHEHPAGPSSRIVSTGSPKETLNIRREDILGLIRALQIKLHKWQQLPSNTTEYLRLAEELLTSCENIEWQLGELEKTISVASPSIDPAYYRLDEVELSRLREWSGSARNQVGAFRSALEKGRNYSEMGAYQHIMDKIRMYHNSSEEHDYISSEPDRRQQHDELNEISASVQRVRGTGSIELSRQIGKLQTTFHRWQLVSSNTIEHVHLKEEILSSCDRIESQVDLMEKEIPAYYLLNEVRLPRRWELTRYARNQVASVRSALSMFHNSSEQHDDYISSESERQLLALRQNDEVQRTGGIGLSMPDELSRQDSAQNNHPCFPLDEKATIKAMKIVSTSTLTVIAALSTYSAETVAPLARGRLAQEMLLVSPYVCLAVGLIGVAFSLCATESNGLAEYASVAVLLVCLFGIGLGASAVSIILEAAQRSVVVWTYVLIVALICSWGWLFTYPRCLKFIMRMYYWDCFDQRTSTNPLRAVYANRGTGQHMDNRGFCRILSNSFAACRRAFLPLDEDTTIDILMALSPAVLTGISGICLFAVHTVAPRAYSVTLQRFLYTMPYFYLPLGVVAIALIVSASKSNGLASYASSLCLGLCVWGIVLGACCCIVVLRSRVLVSGIVAAVLSCALICAWGWMFAYPKNLNWAMRKTICLSCARRLRIVPLGRFEGCGSNSWAWILKVLKVIGRNMVLFPSNCLTVCLNAAQGWWAAGHACFAAADLDPEAQAAELEMISQVRSMV